MNYSNSTITLSAIVDVESNTNFNVNSITTLESERVQYLIKNGSTFEDAKSSAGMRYMEFSIFFDRTRIIRRPLILLNQGKIIQYY